jgi:hypothetical protein
MQGLVSTANEWEKWQIHMRLKPFLLENSHPQTSSAEAQGTFTVHK